MATESKYASLIMRHVQVALKESPSANALYNLLKIADPELTYDGIRTKTQRKKAYNALKKDVSKALLVQMEAFFRKCDSLEFSRDSLRDRASSPPPAKKARTINYTMIVSQFNCFDNWSFLELRESYRIDKVANNPSVCYNLRGHIVHHRLVRRSSIGALYHVGESAFECLPAPEDGSNTAAAIKQEVMINGPVLTTKFKPSHDIARVNSLTVDQVCGGIIMGWKIKPGVGEAWIICVADKSGVGMFDVPVGTCSVEECIKVPKNDLQQKKWQRKAPYQYPNFSNESDWTNSEEISYNITYDEFDELLTELKAKSVSNLLSSWPEIEIADINIPAKSRRAQITDFMKSGDNERPLRVKARFLEDSEYDW